MIPPTVRVTTAASTTAGMVDLNPSRYNAWGYMKLSAALPVARAVTQPSGERR